jgi:PIN domain nuclease of toxin-antitoxin system
MSYLLDTHAWIWWHTSPAKLSRKVRALLKEPSRYEALFVSAISIWEFCKLLEKGRLGISCDAEEWIDAALQMSKLQVLPLTPRIACRSTTLPGEFHDDPADQIIAASARDANATIITKDERLRQYSHVRTYW